MASHGKASARPDGHRKDAAERRNPKADPAAADNQIKDPQDWVTGHEPMTGAQASYLKTLSEQTHDPKAYDPKLDKAEASKRIDRLRQERSR